MKLSTITLLTLITISTAFGNDIAYCDFSGLTNHAANISDKFVEFKDATGPMLKSGGSLLYSCGEAYINHPLEITAMGIVGWCMVKDILKDYLPGSWQKRFSGRIGNGYQMAGISALAALGGRMLYNKFIS